MHWLYVVTLLGRIGAVEIPVGGIVPQSGPAIAPGPTGLSLEMETLAVAVVNMYTSYRLHSTTGEVPKIV